ncbi:MAG: cold shock and DUF1294 domain-containing protein [Pseudomonadota bacterium]
MRYQGKLTDWKDDQGFGFITPNGGGKRVFVHIKSFSNRKRRPSDLEIVTYEISSDTKGRTHAEKVMYVGERLPSYTSSDSNFAFVIIFAFLIFIITTILLGKLPNAVAWLYFIASALAFFAYALDKSAAQKNQWRIKESTLHFLALAGGWPGALAAQQVLRHKSKKQSFKILFWITVFINCVVFYWLLTPAGNYFLKSILVSI